MTRDEAIGKANRLATTSGRTFRAYDLGDTWIVVEGWLTDDLAPYFQASPTGRISYHRCRNDGEGGDIIIPR